MNKDQLFFLGTFGKPIGLKGEISFRFDCDNPADYQKINAIFIKTKNGLIPFKVTKLRLKHGMEGVFQLEGINFVEELNPIKGCDGFLPDSFLPRLSGNQFYYHEIIGYNLNDQHTGLVGKINDVLEYPQHDLFQIKHESGKEILIPVRDELIVKVDRVNREIVVNVPEGLVDIYLSDSKDEEE